MNIMPRENERKVNGRSRRQLVAKCSETRNPADDHSPDATSSLDGMRVAIVAESFLPAVNGVTNSVLRTVEHLNRRGHEPTVIAPSPGAVAGGHRAIERTVGVPVVWLPAARLLGLPTVAVYQTEVPTYAARYGFGGLEPLLWRRVCDIHRRADRTLAPSTAACASLRDRGVPEVRWWGRGVDLDRFRPERRSRRLRARFGPPDVVAVGYVGGLAAEKQLEDLAGLGAS